jgi:hypothetical protein
MHNSVYPIRALNFSQFLLNYTSEKNITWEKWLTHAHHTAPCCPLNPQSGMKHLQIQILPQICRSNMLVLGFRPGTIPSWRFDFHFKVNGINNHIMPFLLS